jgi:1-deoxy-D-xylulose-5-phosphate reductoisomerase
MNRKTISIWGSTGSIGTQALDVIGRHPDRFRIAALTAHSNAALLYEQALRFRPDTAVLTGDRADAREWRDRFRSLGVDFLSGREGLLETASRGAEDLVLNALVGAVGLEATLGAIRANVSIALANKEVLVMAGDMVTGEIRKRSLKLLPVDSEHSAVFQCLEGEDPRSVEAVYLTASGGPFLNKSVSDMEKATAAEALAHPNWSMGRKVTIDSATLVNKGLEVIEARWLFNMPVEKIRVVVHPQSVVHSMVEFTDGSVKAQLGAPDMRIPIAVALAWPERWPQEVRRMDFSQPHALSFQAPDSVRFPALGLAYAALRAGGTSTAVYNAADEAAVRLFLEGRIRFFDIPRLLEAALEKHTPIQNPSLEAVLEADDWTRRFIVNALSKGNS